MELDLLFYPESPFRLYTLIFLLGSLTVSSLSDIRRMAAQADFAEVWWGFTAFMFAADAGLGAAGYYGLYAFLTKWLLLFIFALVIGSTKIVSMSTMDTAALCALFSCLDAPMMAFAAGMILALNEILKPILRSYGEGGAYPFLPTVLAANLALLAFELAGIF